MQIECKYLQNMTRFKTVDMTNIHFARSKLNKTIQYRCRHQRGTKIQYYAVFSKAQLQQRTKKKTS